MNTGHNNNLTEIWAAQKNNSLLDAEQFEDGLLNNLKLLDRDQKRKFYLKTASVIILLPLYLWLMLFTGTPSLLRIIGTSIVAVSVTGFMLIYNMKKFSISKLNIAMPMADLLETALSKLSDENKLYKIYIPLLIAALTIGNNLSIYGGMEGTYHTSGIKDNIYFSVLFLGVSIISLRIKQLDYNAKSLPMIMKLNSALNNIKNGKGE